MKISRAAVIAIVLSVSPLALGQLPPPPDGKAMAPWSFPWGDGVPGAVSAGGLIDKPAGREGAVVSRDGHFYEGDHRIRFIGVSIAFGGNFPSHAQADALAERLAGYGINLVRFHHMDNQPYPNGIFADAKLERLSDEALDRLDYFIAALKRQGIYADLNLHVSRDWLRVNHRPNADKVNDYDKQVDTFDPKLIAANKQYARALLTHVNAYTHNRYADEPAVALVEINNEDTLFLWGGEQSLAALPEPYAGMLQKRWNQWLIGQYGTREKLTAAWKIGLEPLGAELTGDPAAAGSKWVTEQHGTAAMTVGKTRLEDYGAATRIDVTAIDPVEWHLQFNRPGIKLIKGKYYTLSFMAKADQPRKLSVGIGMAHDPWENLGLDRSLDLTNKWRQFRFGFAARADDADARLSFLLGMATGPLSIGDVSLRAGGGEGLRAGEDPAVGGVARGGLGADDTPARARDWYRFLQATDEAYFTDMRKFLQRDLGVKAAITGTIGLGMLGTMSQRSMDFVDAHAYWQHPQFPHRQWDMSDWVIPNTPMVDDPSAATFWNLAATRVCGKPFTVTEYNHAAPNDWQAECVPMIFAYAAIQDWDAVVLFDYGSDTNYRKQSVTDFFSIEGNAAKLAPLPLAARLFMGGAVAPAATRLIVRPQMNPMLDNASAYFYQQWPYLRDIEKVAWQDVLTKRLCISFEGKTPPPASEIADHRVSWTAAGPGMGRFTLKDSHAAVFVGFAKGPMPIDLGAAQIVSLQSPFATFELVAADAKQPLATADRLLLSAVARVANTPMRWNANRTSVSNNWGGGPEKIEVVSGQIQIVAARGVEVWALDSSGKRMKQVPSTFANGKATITLGTEPTLWYEIDRR